MHRRRGGPGGLGAGKRHQVGGGEGERLLVLLGGNGVDRPVFVLGCLGFVVEKGGGGMRETA